MMAGMTITPGRDIDHTPCLNIYYEDTDMLQFKSYVTIFDMLEGKADELRCALNIIKKLKETSGGVSVNEGRLWWESGDSILLP